MVIIGNWAFDPASRRLLAGREERRLSPKAADVLQALAETPWQVWSRDALLERAWPGVTVGEEVLTQAIAELRRKLGDDFRDPNYVETVHKRGYRLKCPVKDTSPSSGEASQDPVMELNLHTYASYLEACDLFERGGSHNTTKALGLFASSAELEPDFSPAHVGMAKALAFLGIYYRPRTTDLEKALDHCEAARRSNPRSAEAFAAQGFIYAVGNDYGRARRNFGVAIRLDPKSSEVHYLLGRACFADLDLELAGPMLERAAALRRDDYYSLIVAGKARQMKGDEARARSNFAQAAARIEPRLDADPDDFRAACGWARCLIYLERFTEASALLERLRDHSDPLNYNLACTFAQAGETLRALDTLEELVDQGWNHRAWLDRDPDFDGVRQDKRFKRIAESVGRR